MGLGVRRLTYDDYAAIPADRNRYQLIEGSLDVTPSPSTSHQTVSMRLQHLLVSHVEKNRLGRVLDAPIDVLLDKHSVVQPDILFVAADHLAIIEPAFLRGAPDLIVEILSPSTEKVDRTAKSRLYAKHGVRFYWIVDIHAKSIEENVLVRGRWKFLGRRAGVFEPKIFPGIRIEVPNLFLP